MFKKLTKFLVKQMDSSKELVPVESIADNEHFRPLCLLTKKSKRKTIFHPAPYFKQARVTLDDVLLPGEDGKSIEPLQQDSSQFTLRKASADQVDGGLSISCDPASVELKGAASLSKLFSTKPQKKSISLESLETLKKRQINMDHSFIQQLQRTNINLYVVIEILEASEETIYEESTKAKGRFGSNCWAPFTVQCAREDNQSIVIPKGCTLAFRAIQLKIRDGAWDLDYFQIEGFESYEIEDLDNFQIEGFESYEIKGRSLGKLGEVKEEFKYRCQISKLSPDLLLIVLNTIKAVMRDGNLLQEFSQKMEDLLEENDGYELKTESPDLKDLFSILQRKPTYLFQLAEGITYILDALHELMEDQLWLLLESLERKIVSQQLKLVENLLEHDLENKEEPFHVDAELLSFPHKEEQKLTMALVELSGVQLQEDGSALPRDQPFEAVAALFVALYALNLLSGSE